MGLKRNKQKEEENRMWCFRSQGEESMSRQKVWSITSNAAEHTREEFMSLIGFHN